MWAIPQYMACACRPHPPSLWTADFPDDQTEYDFKIAQSLIAAIASSDSLGMSRL